MKKPVAIFEEFINAQDEQDVGMQEVLESLDISNLFTQEQILTFGVDTVVIARQNNRDGIVPEGLYQGYLAQFAERYERDNRKTWEDASGGFAFTDDVGDKYWFCIIDSEGGGEGEGEHVERIVAVFKYGDHSDALVGLVQVTGFYSSDYGTEWDTEYNEVTPKPKTVIAWVLKVD